MPSPPTRPSTKGYQPVATAERIDDDVEQPQTAQDDDDDIYTTTPAAPLLPARGNEPLRRDVGKPCWYHRSWNPFRRNPDPHRSWEPRKPRNWRRIFLFSFIGFLLLAVIGLATSTGILASEFQHYRSSRGRCDSYSYERHSHMPLSDKRRSYMSSNGRLNFPSMYPPLENGASWACMAAWQTLAYVPCHEKIWNRSWDNGTTSLFQPDPSVYSNAICTSNCKVTINNAFRLINAQCTENDKFELAGYEGAFLFDNLEDGPLGVITTLASRMQHTCRTEPGRYSYNPQYCMATLWDDWHIVDGMNAGNLEGLDQFDAKTRYSGESRYWSRAVRDPCDDVNYFSYSYYRSKPTKWGPSKNSTTCDFCTMDYFSRKLQSWKKGEVKDPKTGETVELVDYLTRIKRVGERCEADAWDRAYSRAVHQYKQRGELDKDWDGEDDMGVWSEPRPILVDGNDIFPTIEAN